MYKIKYLILLGLAFFLTLSGVHAQQDSVISGLVLERGSSTRIPQANVTNLRTNQVVVSNNYGVFNIGVEVGDSLSVSKIGYGPIKTRINTLEDILIDLHGGTQIETVVITRSTKEAEMRAMLDDYESKGVYNGGRNKFGTYLASPATALYNLFGKEAKNAKRFEQFMGQELEATKVDRVFTKALVSRLTKLEDEELRSFMDIYRPSPASIDRWGEYDLLNYINRSFKSWDEQGRPKSQRLPKLEIPPQEK
ncbi:MAG: hypothetical protein ACTHWQ_09770 [Sphingobacterium sp.]